MRPGRPKPRASIASARFSPRSSDPASSGESRRACPRAPCTSTPRPRSASTRPTRVALEHRDEPRRERDGERRTPGPRSGTEQAVVVEQQHVGAGREADGREAQRVQRREPQLLARHRELAEHRHDRPREERMRARLLEPRREHEDHSRRERHPDEENPPRCARRAQAHDEQHERDRRRPPTAIPRSSAASASAASNAAAGTALTAPAPPPGCSSAGSPTTRRRRRGAAPRRRCGRRASR